MPLLRSPRRKLYLVDCVIRPYKIEAGWVYAEAGITNEVETVKDAEGQEYKVFVPREIRGLEVFATLSHATEQVEFSRCFTDE